MSPSLIAALALAVVVQRPKSAHNAFPATPNPVRLALLCGGTDNAGRVPGTLSASCGYKAEHSVRAVRPVSQTVSALI